MLYLDGQPIAAKKVEQLHPRRKTVHRLEIEPCSSRHIIPPTTTTVIVKQQKDGWEEEFRLEREAYDRLHELQGTMIPVLFGQGSFNGLPALILSDIAGTTLHDIKVQQCLLQSQLEKTSKPYMSMEQSIGTRRWTIFYSVIIAM
ncbi:hypothetical protein P170DRAFT_8147 [Aspergillus steynii IBT 23096]|uniref:Protein kinase domain-containing protein n=1 Tax=Aspergillus steynii IBT 23096 TaxID=1392250 RepID=A0A2I2GMJ1_9EURO|nr:uncharacterized protein P170DRAFT_8147 [Aspergillus steynii IBT 23096]PLB54085.1 hypothetical protein P170DRAFT_8147 [Aspergillus steynii IBT 23096]